MANQQQQQLLVLLLVVVSPAWAGLISYVGDATPVAVAHTQQNVLRNFDGTVSHYAKSLATPYSQVHKQDTRISNNVYQPAYAAPAPAPAAVYAQPAPVYHQAQPQLQQHIPAYTPHHQPAVVHYSPAESVSHMSFDGFGTHWGY